MLTDKTVLPGVYPVTNTPQCAVIIMAILHF